MTKKILIADDEQNIVISLEFLMKREGFAVCVAGDGEEALEMARRERPDLVLLDVMMPRRNGYEVCQALRADPDLQHLLSKAVDRVNAELSVVEKVRRFILADEPFTVENEQLTPSMKIRRHVIKAIYGDRLDALYKK